MKNDQCFKRNVLDFVARLREDDLECPNSLYLKLASHGFTAAAVEALYMSDEAFENYISYVQMGDTNTGAYS